MKKLLLIAQREIRERLRSRSFRWFSIFGPLVVLLLVYLLFNLGGTEQKKWLILVADDGAILDNKMMANKDESMEFAFINQYLEIEDFAQNDKYQQFDALVEINHKIVSNKVSHVFYRVKPGLKEQKKIQYYVERRLEEIMVQRFTSLKLQEFRKIKQPITFSFVDCYDPEEKANTLGGYLGLGLAGLIVLFIGLYGMSVLRSISFEKSNRLVEILMASMRPNQLLAGKIVGIGVSAMIQFLIWVAVVGVGLYFMRSYLFIDIYDPSNIDFTQISAGLEKANSTFIRERSTTNYIVEFFFREVDFLTVIGGFLLFLVAGYLVYSSFFAIIGASAGSESDGQQFVFPLLLILGLAIYSGYFYLEHPSHWLSQFFAFFPFTAPVVAMIKLASGMDASAVLEFWLAWMITLGFAFAFLGIAARIYKRGALKYGHRLTVGHLFTWMKRND